MKDTDLEKMSCPLQVTQALLSGKYKVNIIFHLMEGRKRFSQLQRDIPEASAKVLAQELHEMAADDLLTRTVYPEVPVRTEYALTEYGRTLCPIVIMMYQWGKNVFLAQNKDWPCNDSDIEKWISENFIAQDDARKIIFDKHKKADNNEKQ